MMGPMAVVQHFDDLSLRAKLQKSVNVGTYFVIHSLGPGHFRSLKHVIHDPFAPLDSLIGCCGASGPQTPASGDSHLLHKQSDRLFLAAEHISDVEL